MQLGSADCGAHGFALLAFGAARHLFFLFWGRHPRHISLGGRVVVEIWDGGGGGRMACSVAVHGEQAHPSHMAGLSLRGRGRKKKEEKKEK